MHYKSAWWSEMKRISKLGTEAEGIVYHSNWVKRDKFDQPLWRSWILIWDIFISFLHPHREVQEIDYNFVNEYRLVLHWILIKHCNKQKTFFLFIRFNRLKFFPLINHCLKGIKILILEVVIFWKAERYKLQWKVMWQYTWFTATFQLCLKQLPFLWILQIS